MERLFANFWMHVDGTHIHAYERIAAFHQVPLRVTPEEAFPSRIPIELRILLLERLVDAAKVLEAQPAQDTRLLNLERQLEQFPNWARLSEPQRKAFRDTMSEGLNPIEENQVSSLELFTEALERVRKEKAEQDGQKREDAPGLGSILGEEETKEDADESPPETERGKVSAEA